MYYTVVSKHLFTSSPYCRYYLYHWPISMAIIFVSGIFFSISAMTLLLWARKMMDRVNQFTIQQRQLNQRVQARRLSGGGGVVRRKTEEMVEK